MNLNGYDIVRRHDNSVAIYDYAWWPDPYLDSDIKAHNNYLNATGGWRAKGWIVVHVTDSIRAARAWIAKQHG